MQYCHWSSQERQVSEVCDWIWNWPAKYTQSRNWYKHPKIYSVLIRSYVCLILYKCPPNTLQHSNVCKFGSINSFVFTEKVPPIWSIVHLFLNCHMEISVSFFPAENTKWFSTVLLAFFFMIEETFFQEIMLLWFYLWSDMKRNYFMKEVWIRVRLYIMQTHARVLCLNMAHDQVCVEYRSRNDHVSLVLGSHLMTKMTYRRGWDSNPRVQSTMD